MLVDARRYYTQLSAYSSLQGTRPETIGYSLADSPVGLTNTGATAAISMFPREQVRLSRRWAEARFADLVHVNQLPAGGHLAALEQPALLADAIRTAFRSLR